MLHTNLLFSCKNLDPAKEIIKTIKTKTIQIHLSTTVFVDVAAAEVVVAVVIAAAAATDDGGHDAVARHRCRRRRRQRPPSSPRWP